jgi:hypothetical protein
LARVMSLQIQEYGWIHGCIIIKESSSDAAALVCLLAPVVLLSTCTFEHLAWPSRAADWTSARGFYEGNDADDMKIRRHEGNKGIHPCSGFQARVCVKRNECIMIGY